ncbi:hypothetical protein PGT21_000022 [Puccinia graminis f. sp. tritici]|uniref:Uncharacterized protein n=1 Tax=Puccinia graminis f. sp. tritici TaxID=56615 RepID=A0A5B0QDC8_PUCGR|nr:hypothetical protein PGT21_000022 [Puccinia graminis f. sp. tritici]
MRLSITDKGTSATEFSLPLSSKKTPRFGSRVWLVGVNWPEIDPTTRGATNRTSFQVSPAKQAVSGTTQAYSKVKPVSGGKI